MPTAKTIAQEMFSMPRQIWSRELKLIMIVLCWALCAACIYVLYIFLHVFWPYPRETVGNNILKKGSV